MIEQPAHQTTGQSLATGRTLCFGGSFNPIHVGHLICARQAAEVGGFNRIRLIPTAANPHKVENGSVDVAAAAERLAMCRMAVVGDPFFEVDPIEVERSGNSYTFDTAAKFIARGEKSPIDWLIGTDILSRLHTWHRFDELLGIVEFVVMRRAAEPYELENLDPRVQNLVARIVEVPQVEASATAIRQRVCAGKPIDHWVPASVARHIANGRLYLP